MRPSAPFRASIGGVSYTDLNGAPYRATYNDPQATGGRIRSWGAYVQDTWTLNDRATLNLGLRYDAIHGDVPELSSDAEIEGTDGSTFSPPSRHLSGRRGPGLVQHGLAPRRLHAPARRIGTDGAQVGLRAVLRQARDRDVLRHLAGRRGHGRARVQRDHRRLHDSRQRHRPQAQLRRRFRPGQPVHRSGVGRHRAPDRRRRRHRGVVRLQERSRFRPPAGHPRRLRAPRHRRHLRRSVADHYRAVAHQRRRLAAVHGGQPRRPRPELQVGRRRVQQALLGPRAGQHVLHLAGLEGVRLGFGQRQHPAGLQQPVADRRLRPRPERHAERLRAHRDQRRACRQAVGDVSAAVGLPARRALLLRSRTTLRAADHRPRHGRRPGRRDHPGRTPAGPTRCPRSTTSRSASTRTSASAATGCASRSTCSTSSTPTRC